MGKSLVIVESPAKIKTLRKFLGPHYFFESSIGHIVDLPQKEFGIDIKNDFEPKYAVLPDKKAVVKKLQDAAKKADIVYLSPDPDREGEAIAWHIASILPKNIPIKRSTFQSITKSAVQAALENPRDIDMDLVNAQQARRLLDRIVGYKISPILSRRVRRGSGGSSAGRVQSVALKLVVDREKAIEAFIPVEYWTITALFSRESEGKNFEATVFTIDGLKIEKEKDDNKKSFQIANATIANQIVDRLQSASYHVALVEKKEKRRSPPPPFITSTLQQEASRHFGFSVSRTMSIAQELYEGVDLGSEGAEGLITYMRTDSVNIVPEAIQSAREFIKKEYGAEYLPEQPRFFSSKKSAQEAHEAIRPTNFGRSPEKIQKHLNTDQFKLYQLIWRRLLASQMNPAIYDTMSVDIESSSSITLRATGSVIKFSGYLAVYEEKKDTEESEEEGISHIPILEIGDSLILQNLNSAQSFTKPPARFTEASLVKELERLGIGRPSTYAAIMNKIQSRDYTIKENQALKPTELGRIICQMLEENFGLIMDVSFTAQMEDQLEQVAEHHKNWKELVRNFWSEFFPLVEKAEKNATVPRITTDLDCPKCGKKLQKIWAKKGYFYGCSNYPSCDYTAPITVMEFKREDFDPNFNWDSLCPVCESVMILRHGRFGPFLGCSRYPDCTGIINIPKKGEISYRADEMPNCPAIGCNGSIVSRKSRFGKTFFSCSSFPDCNVIASSLEELPQKYAHHPKTAYIKKSRFAKKSAPKQVKKTARPASRGKERELSPELAAVLNEKHLSRANVLKKTWEYIKTNQLQDPKNKRLIIPDKNLAKVFGNDKPVDMMQLPRILGSHLKD